MALQYNLDHGSNLGSFENFVHSQAYSDAFEQALLSAASSGKVDVTGARNSVDLQNLDLYGENFRAGSGFDAAYVSTYDAADSTSAAALDKARVILFDSHLDGVTTSLAGGTSHFVGLTQGDDFINVGGRADQVIDGGSGGDDVILTGRGNDTVTLGSGNNEVHTGAGNDMIVGNTGNDLLDGGRGDDSLFGGGGEDTVIGGSGFDVATVDGNKADFHFTGHEWVNDVTGAHINGVEYTNVDDGVLITVQSNADAEVARLFQAVNNQDPTAADYKSALVALHNGSSLADIAKTIVDGADGHNDLAGGPLTTAADKTAFVKTVIENLFDGSTGEWTPSHIADYVSHLPNWDKAKIVADLVHQVTTADDHIGIHVDSTSV